MTGMSRAGSLSSAGDERVLVVDDRSADRECLSQLLRDHGCPVLEAATLDEAQRQTREETVDLILLKASLAGAIDWLRKLPNTHQDARQPVIVLADDDGSNHVFSALEAGASDYLLKPLSAATTLARVRTHLALRRTRLALQESEERFLIAARGTNDGIWDWNLVTGEVYYSPRWLEILGFREGDIGATLEDWWGRVHFEDRCRVKDELEAYRRGETCCFETEFRMLHVSGVFRWMLCRALALRDSEGRTLRIAGSLADITEGKVADALTGLPNRLLFLDRLQRSIDRRRRDPRHQFAVLYLDIDDFKLVNDTLGHEFGDQLLVTLARRLENCVRSSDTIVARLGGDEFTVLVENIARADEAVIVADRILAAISRPVVLSGREVPSSASIGISFSSDRCGSPAEMLREADTAMYQSKAQGKSSHRLYSPAMREQVATRLELEGDLKLALERDELTLDYQPVVNLVTRRIVGFEALARWQHPRLGTISPGQFMPIAEETGIIVPIGTWVVQEACRQLVEWITLVPQIEDLIISVNVSNRQFAHGDFAKRVAEIVDITGVRSGLLKVEITENTIMDNPEHAAALLGRLRELGVRVGIDDFGTGYSSLAYLHRLPIDFLKVDRSFVSSMDHSGDEKAIVQTILTLASCLRLGVVAEGIERARQREQLITMGCPFGQGFLFSRPLDRNKALQLIRQTLDNRVHGSTGVDLAGGVILADASLLPPADTPNAASGLSTL